MNAMAQQVVTEGWTEYAVDRTTRCDGCGEVLPSAEVRHYDFDGNNYCPECWDELVAKVKEV